MSDDGIAEPTTIRSTTDVGNLLFWGAIAATLAGILGAAGSALQLERGPEPGFSLATVMNLLALVPQFVALLAFLRMTVAIDAEGLRKLYRGAICLFGLSLMFACATTITDLSADLPDKGVGLSLLVVGIGCVTLFLYATGTGNFGFVLALYFGVRYLGGWMIEGKRFDALSSAAISTVVLAAISVLAYPIWFAANLLRERVMLGPPASWLAAIILFGLILSVVFGGYAAAMIIATPGLEKMNDDEIDKLLATHMKQLSFISIAVELAIGMSLAILLLRARGQLIQPAAIGASE